MHPLDAVTFDEVRNEVRWHYQWMLVTDFLPAVINDGLCGFKLSQPLNL